MLSGFFTAYPLFRQVLRAPAPVLSLPKQIANFKRLILLENYSHYNEIIDWENRMKQQHTPLQRSRLRRMVRRLLGLAIVCAGWALILQPAGHHSMANQPVASHPA